METQEELNDYDNWRDIDKDVTILFLKQPQRIVFAVISYLFLIFALKIYMRSREPYVLFTPIRIYNIILVAINTYMTYTIFRHLDYGRDYFRCHPLHHGRALYIAKHSDFFILTRIIEFLDTIFFTLRKKDNQVSFLHVFHHTYVPIMGIIMAADVDTPFIFVAIGLNSFIHIIMYAYYALATFKNLQPFLWWKRYLTSLQMAQFVAIISLSCYQLYINNCKYTPYKVLYFSILTGVIFLGLFANFYIQAYMRKGSATTKKRHND